MKARENPFRAERIESLKYRFDSGDLNSLLLILAQRDYRGAIVGPKGTGKTTLIEEIYSALIERGLTCSRLRLADQSHLKHQQVLDNWLEETGRDSILILDSAGQLRWWDWKRFQKQSRAYAGLIISRHTPGCLPTLIRCRSNLQRFEELVSELDETNRIPRQRLIQLYKRHRGNIRDCLRSLYDEWALL